MHKITTQHVYATGTFRKLCIFHFWWFPTKPYSSLANLGHFVKESTIYLSRRRSHPAGGKSSDVAVDNIRVTFSDFDFPSAPLILPLVKGYNPCRQESVRCQMAVSVGGYHPPLIHKIWIKIVFFVYPFVTRFLIIN